MDEADDGTIFGADIPFARLCGIEALGIVEGRTRLRLAPCRLGCRPDLGLCRRLGGGRRLQIEGRHRREGRAGRAGQQGRDPQG